MQLIYFMYVLHFLPDYHPHISFAEMSGDILSFIKRSYDYNDLFPNDDLKIFGALVDATHVSRVPPPAQVKKECTLAEKKRYRKTSKSQASTPETRPSRGSALINWKLVSPSQ